MWMFSVVFTLAVPVDAIMITDFPLKVYGIQIIFLVCRLPAATTGKESFIIHTGLHNFIKAKYTV